METLQLLDNKDHSYQEIRLVLDVAVVLVDQTMELILEPILLHLEEQLKTSELDLATIHQTHQHQIVEVEPSELEDLVIIPKNNEMIIESNV